MRLRLRVMDKENGIHETVVEAEGGSASFLKRAALNQMPITGVFEEGEAGTYREGWKQRGRELNALYEIIGPAIFRHGIKPTGNAVEDLRCVIQELEDKANYQD